MARSTGGASGLPLHAVWPAGASMRALAALFMIASACGSESIALTKSAPDEAGVSTPRCSQIPDCPGGTYCEKAACPDAMGTCELVPAQCTDEEAPVCGCDRITYFNDCLRRASGIASMTLGACRTYECGGMQNTPCPDGTLCAR